MNFKKTILLVAGLWPLALMAQSGYTITGKMPALKVPAKAYLVTIQKGAWKETDSVEVKGGKFQFKGSVNEPQQAILAVKRTGVPEVRTQGDQLGFFLENSNIVFTATDSIIKSKVTGSVADRESHELEAQVRPLTNNIIRLNNKFSKYNKASASLTAEERKIASDSVANWVTEIRDIKLKFVETHLNSFMGLYTYSYSILGSKFNPAAVEPLYHKLSPQLQASELGKRTAEKIEIAKRGQAGIKVTDFTQNDVNGKAFTLSSLRGKYVLVDFWASWCAPCRAENPNVRKAYQALKDKNFEIVSVSLDMGKPQWVDAINKDGMPWIHVSDLKGWKNEVAILYGVNSVPQNLLIDPRGVIVARDLRGDDLTAKLSAYIK
ncbi:TlpA disulfide reductase family protein [Mucilaginibacter sp. PAMB04274]|uniref:TlpA disulfide reductase family protein n=1 Tax=Mucilaginibacter sp. PAMB04274 TaxID=3138568 RepID=UPI0031F6708D